MKPYETNDIHPASDVVVVDRSLLHGNVVVHKDDPLNIGTIIDLKHKADVKLIEKNPVDVRKQIFTWFSSHSQHFLQICSHPKFTEESTQNFSNLQSNSNPMLSLGTF